MFKKLTPLSGILMVVLIGLMLYGLIDSGILSTGDTGVDKLLGLNKGSGSAPMSAREASKYRSAAPLQALTWKNGWESDPFYYAEAETTNALGGGILGSLFGAMDGGDRPSLELSMISWNGNIGMALVNGDILEEGDRVAGYQITKIAFDHIILRKGTSIVKVNLND
ncbi:MAG: hypothetical protein HQ508_04375 [Candidatus Marinimicrobia bacterium]|nr:hypothetical protein [Candidatus Neomarinimicrobiota bacterium]